MKFINLILFLFFIASVSSAQSPSLEWQKTFGTTENEEPRRIKSTGDGHLMMIGFRQPKDRYDIDLLLVKITTNGEVLWEKTYGGETVENGHDLLELTDGSWVLLGEKVTEANRSDVWLLKVDREGNLFWEKNLGGAQREEPISMLLNHENQIVITGVKEAKASRIPYAFVMKATLEGEEISTEIYGSDNHKLVQNEAWYYGKGEGANKIIQTKDKGYLLAGHTMTRARKGLATDGWLCKIDKEGKEKWTAAFGAIGGDNIMDAFEDVEGNIYVSGIRYSKPMPFTVSQWLLKFTADGQQVFDKHYNIGNFCTGGKSMFYNSESILLVGSTNNTLMDVVNPDTLSLEVIQERLLEGWEEIWANDKKYLINDYSKNGHKDINEDAWLIQTDLKGNKIWDLVLPGGEDDKAMALCKTKAGEVFVAGYTYSNSKGGKDIFLLKIN